MATPAPAGDLSKMGLRMDPITIAKAAVAAARFVVMVDNAVHSRHELLSTAQNVAKYQAGREPARKVVVQDMSPKPGKPMIWELAGAAFKVVRNAL